MKTTLVGVAWLCAAALAGQQQLSGEQILRRAEERSSYQTYQADADMISKNPIYGEQKNSFRVYGRGSHDILIEFTSSANQGQKILRLRRKLYLYSPDSEDILLLQGAALQQSIGGSDLSYQDISETNSRADIYDVKRLADEQLDGVLCWQIHLTIKPENRRDAAYPQVKFWIDQQSLALRQGQFFSSTGTLIKEFQALAFQEQGGVLVTTESVYRDVMQGESETRLLVRNVKVNQPLADSLFSLSNLGF